MDEAFDDADVDLTVSQCQSTDNVDVLAQPLTASGNIANATSLRRPVSLLSYKLKFTDGV